MDAFTAIVLRDRDFLRNACACLLVVPDDAEDAVQDALLNAWRARRQMPTQRAGQRRWLYRIARNACFSRNRREQTLRRILPRLAAPRAPTLAVDGDVHLDLIDLDIALGRLPPLHREALVVNAEMSGPEAAARLGVARGTVKSRAFRARARLRAVSA